MTDLDFGKWCKERTMFQDCEKCIGEGTDTAFIGTGEFYPNPSEAEMDKFLDNFTENNTGTYIISYLCCREAKKYHGIVEFLNDGQLGDVRSEGDTRKECKQLLVIDLFKTVHFRILQSFRSII